MTHAEVDAKQAGQQPQDLVEAIRVQAEEHPLIDDKAPETLREKCLHLMHLKAYAEAKLLTAGCDVLDVGCNTGYGTVQLVGEARSVTGVDVSPGAIAAARARAGADDVEFRLIDGFGLPFADDSFDLVTSFQVIEHVADPKPYLLEIKRVLRPGGRALFTTPNAAIRLDEGMAPWNRFHAHEYRADELGRALAEVFSDVEVRGMFGVPSLYELEIKRVELNRQIIRKRNADAAAAAAAGSAAGAATATASAVPDAAPAGPRTPVPSRAVARRPSLLLRLRRRFGRTSAGSFARRLLGRTNPAPVPTPPPVAPTQAVQPNPPAAAPTPVVIPDVPDIDAYVVNDLFYSGRDLDLSMDLLAVCRAGD